MGENVCKIEQGKGASSKEYTLGETEYWILTYHISHD